MNTKNMIYVAALSAALASCANKYEVKSDVKYSGFNGQAISAEFPNNAKNVIAIDKIPGERYDSTAAGNKVCYTGFFGRTLADKNDTPQDQCHGSVVIEHQAKNTIDAKFK